DEDSPADSSRPALSPRTALGLASAFHAVLVLQAAATREFNAHEVVGARARRATNIDVAVAFQDLDDVVDLLGGQVVVLPLLHGETDSFALQVIATSPLVIGGLAPLGQRV